jgi:hypothetical protein
MLSEAVSKAWVREMISTQHNDDPGDSVTAVEVEVIEDPDVIRRCCYAALANHKLVVCCRCEDIEETIAAIVVFPGAVKSGHPFCGPCFQSFSVWDQA